VRPIPLLLTVGGVLAVAAIVVATISGGSSEDEPPPGAIVTAQPQTPGATPFCTFIPGEGNVCVATPPPVDCRPSTDHIPFIDQLVLPQTLPEGFAFTEACLTSCHEGAPCNQPAEIKYATGDGTARFQVSTAIADTCASADSIPTPLGPITGCVRRIPGSGGEAVYAIDMQKNGRAHTVVAVIGPDNSVTEEQMNAVAVDIASQN
jgi:hypothetical protein